MKRMDSRQNKIFQMRNAAQRGFGKSATAKPGKPFVSQRFKVREGTRDDKQ